MKKPVLRANNLFKSYRCPAVVDVLKGVTLDVEEGKSIAIMGKSGEGKSTLLHLLGTLEKPCQGSLEICGKMVENDAAKFRQEHLGFIFQTFNLLDDYTVLENVLMPARIARKNSKQESSSFERALSLLEQVGLSSRANFPAKLLSGGEKQRAAIARALCNDPQIVLADEPTGNLDRANSLAIHELLLGLVRNFNKTLILVTHDRELAALCDQIYILNNGQLELKRIGDT